MCGSVHCHMLHYIPFSDCHSSSPGTTLCAYRRVMLERAVFECALVERALVEVAQLHVVQQHSHTAWLDCGLAEQG